MSVIARDQQKPARLHAHVADQRSGVQGWPAVKEDECRAKPVFCRNGQGRGEG